jgi:hypothetical protein
LPLGKEKNMRQACFYLSILFFCSCGHTVTDKNDDMLIMTNAQLILSNSILGSYTNTTLRELGKKSEDRYTSVKGAIWFEKATQISELTKIPLDYINTLKNDIVKEIETNPASNIGSFVNNKDHGKSIFKILQQYRFELLSVDSSIRQVFDSVIYIMPEKFDSPESSANEFFQVYFENKDFISILTFLTNIESNIKIAENSTIRFCNNKVSDNTFHFETYAALFNQSSTILKAGEEMKITVAVGAFSLRAKPDIEISNKKIVPNSDGAGRYTFKVPAKAGNYTVPAKIEYRDEEGRTYVEEKVFTYKVSPCQ